MRNHGIVSKSPQSERRGGPFTENTIARDNESEVLAESLSESQVDALASALLESDEPDAKWQVAGQIGKYPMTSARKTILFALALDENEYVRRRVMNLLTASSDKPFS